MLEKPIITSFSVLTYSGAQPIDAYVFTEKDQDCLSVEIIFKSNKALEKGGGDIFSITFYSQNYLTQLAARDEKWPKEGKGMVFVNGKIIKEVVSGYMSKVLEKCPTGDWSEISAYLSQFLNWEFDGY